MLRSIYTERMSESYGSPFRIIVLGTDMKPRKIFVIMGKVPATVLSTVQRYKILSASARKAADKTLSEAYGSNYRTTLALDAWDNLSKHAPPTLSDNDYAGGDNISDDSIGVGGYNDITGGRQHPRPMHTLMHTSPYSPISAWYDPEDYNGMSAVFGGARTKTRNSSTTNSSTIPRENLSYNNVVDPNTPIIVNVADINGTLDSYSAEWFESHRDCISGADLTAPILVTQVGPDLVPRGAESICAVRRAMEIGVRTLPAVVRTTTPPLTSRTIKYNDDLARMESNAKYPGEMHVFQSTYNRIIERHPNNAIGGDEDDDIAALLDATTTVDEPISVKYSTGISPPPVYTDIPVEYVAGISVFSVDKFTELAEKIQYTTGIPIYRQHTCWSECGQLKIAYMVTANGAIESDIRAVSTANDRKDGPTVIGIPVNKMVYNKRDVARVETRDAFKLVGAISAVYVADLAEWLSPARSQLQDILTDSYQMDLLYWGFIVLYWPRLTRECFHVYASAEASIGQLYPDLMPIKSTLKMKLTEEQSWFDHVDTLYGRVEAFARTHTTTSLTSALVSIKNPKVVLNLRNIVDFMNTSEDIPELRAHIIDHPRKYIIRKLHASAKEIQWPPGTMYHNGLNIAVKTTGNMLFINIGADGTVHVKINAPEEDAVGFEEVHKIVSTYANPIIEKINTMGRFVFMTGSSMAIGTKSNIIFGSLNMCVYWKRVLSSAAFNVLKSAFTRLMRAGITQPRSIQQADKHELLFCKGMHWFDATTIDRIMMVIGGQPLMNQYSYMSVANVKQKWDHSYSGRIIRISHRTTDIRFEIVDIREDEFRMMSEHLMTVVYDVSAELRTNPTTPPKNQHRLKKLREEDPDLFNLKKYGSKKVYSILCQNNRQPVIYTPDEVNAMDAAARKKLVKYINFTKNSPAYYACPSSVYPNLGYLVGTHPKGYCLPCCNKRAQAGRKTEIYQKCSTCGKWSGESVGESSRHIMSYSKNTDVGRLSKLPASVHAILNPTGSRVVRGRKRADGNNLTGASTSLPRGHYIMGVEQTLPGLPVAGFAFACARALGMTVHEMFDYIIKAIGSSDMFMSVCAGQLTSVWSTAHDLIDTLRDLFILGRTWTKYSPPQWDTIVFSFVANTFGVGLLYWHDNVVKTSFECFIPDSRHPTAYIMIIRRSEYYVPVVQITYSDYARHGLVGEKTDSTTTEKSNIGPSPGIYGGRSGGVFSKDGPTGILISKIVEWSLIINTRGINWISQSLGQPSTVYQDRYGMVFAAVWNGVYVSFPPEILSGSIGAISREAYNGPVAPVATALELLRKLSDAPLHTTVATDCLHIRAGAIGVICSGDSAGIPGTIDNGMKMTGIAMLDVMRVMHDVTPGVPDESTTGLGRAFYETHQYTLFLIEFVNLLTGERNKVIRGKLAAEIDRIVLPRGIGQLKRSFRCILKDWSDDLAIIMSLIAAASLSGTITRAVLHQIIDSEVYEFDNITISSLRSLDDKTLRNTLMTIVQKFVVEVDKLPDIIEFPNVFGSCSTSRPDGTTAGYCSRKKLMINVPLAGLVDILAADLKNPLKSKYLLNGMWLETTLNWFDFHTNPDERVIVYRT